MDSLNALKQLPPHTLLDELGLVTQRAGKYSGIPNYSKRREPIILDLANFNSRLFKDPLPLRKIISTFEIEPGYGSILGDVETEAAIKALENHRATLSVGNQHQRQVQNALMVEKAGVVVSSGATHGLYLLLLALKLEADSRGDSTKTRIVYSVPNYCLADSFARAHGFEPVPCFNISDPISLPSPNSIGKQLDNRTLALVLSYPANPTMQSWMANDFSKLSSLFLIAEQYGITVIADTVFQEAATDSYVPEIIDLCSPMQRWAKVFSPSKDRPFACGYRIGYSIFSQELTPWVEAAKAITLNSTPTAMQLWIALDSLFRVSLSRQEFGIKDCELLEGRFLTGYKGRRYSAKTILRKINECSLFENYREIVFEIHTNIRAAINEICDVSSSCRHLGVRFCPEFGNMLLFEVKNTNLWTSSIDFFRDLLVERNVSSSVGPCFGIPDDGNIYFRIAFGSIPLRLLLTEIVAIDRWIAGKSMHYKYNGRKNVS
jgi:aspartate/methionine/tyrosine aminotransferase